MENMESSCAEVQSHRNNKIENLTLKKNNKNVTDGKVSEDHMGEMVHNLMHTGT